MPSIEWQRVLPVLFSILVIILIAILRNYSKTIAAITATMPINVPLAIWILSTGGSTSQVGMVQFIESLIIGLIPTFVFLIVAYIAARAGWQVAPLIVAGYVGWGVTLLILLFVQSQLGGRA
ncbi:MAG: hypothetical protein IAE80_19575 [Anaerolinea sp.]|nr:hypothetical protein [Anaerolinea sp.]